MRTYGPKDGPRGPRLTEEQEFRRRALREAADRARSPYLDLDRFTAEAPDQWIDDVEVADTDDRDAVEDAWAAPAKDKYEAWLRRGALILAANTIVDECFDDLAALSGPEVEFDEDMLAGTFAGRWLPPRFRSHYDQVFLRRLTATACKVAADLADPGSGRCACLAEEMVMGAIAAYADRFTQQAGLGAPWMGFEDILLEDTDFEILWDEDSDGIEDDPATQRACDLYVPGPADWFTPFNRARHPHPYAETEESAPQPNILNTLLFEDLETFDVDAVHAVGSMKPASDVVAQARELARAEGQADVWVADENNHEASYAALVRTVDAGADEDRYGSGWLTWEPHEGADLVRTDRVMLVTAHRHYPHPDVPFLEVSINGMLVFNVPLTSVVSYRSDPKIRRDWQTAHDSFFGFSDGDNDEQ